MLVIKYEKKDMAVYVSHIDLLRHIDKIMRRAQLTVNFSQGFNPHPLVFFSPPNVVGVTSLCEYVFINTDVDSKEAFEKFKVACPNGIVPVSYFEVKKNPNLQATVVASDFVFPCEYKDIDFSKPFEIKYKKKGEEKEEEVSEKIFGSFNMDGKLCIRLASGNSNLRPDRILPKLNEILGTDMSLLDVVKTNQYIKIEDKFVDVDESMK